MAIAQSETTKQTPTLPKAGDIGLGIDLVPIFDYVGNMFNGTAGNGLASFGGDPVLMSGPLSPTLSIRTKYMLTDDIALRLNLAALGVSANEKLYVQDDLAFFNDPLSEAKLIDSYRYNRTGAEIAAGAEYRRGYNRIQGYFGLDLIYGIQRTSDTYFYANAITEINQTPSRATGLAMVAPTPLNVPYWTRTYVTGRYHDGNEQFVGIGGNIGVEFFLRSHLSLGGEVFLYAIQYFSQQTYQKQEGFNTLTNEVETRVETISPGDNYFTFGTDNLGGKLYMMFYF